MTQICPDSLKREVKKIDPKQSHAEMDIFSYVKTDAFVKAILVRYKTGEANWPFLFKAAPMVNKQAINQLIMERLRQSGCEVIQAEGDANVEIAKVAVTKSPFQSTTLAGEDTDILLMLLYYTETTNCTALYFRSDKVK